MRPFKKLTSVSCNSLSGKMPLSWFCAPIVQLSSVSSSLNSVLSNGQCVYSSSCSCSVMRSVSLKQTYNVWKEEKHPEENN